MQEPNEARTLMQEIFGAGWRKKAAQLLSVSVEHIDNIACGNQPLRWRHYRTLWLYTEQERYRHLVHEREAAERAIKAAQELARSKASANTKLKAILAEFKRRGKK